jgi:hypothetical protein
MNAQKAHPHVNECTKGSFSCKWMHKRLFQGLSAFLIWEIFTVISYQKGKEIWERGCKRIFLKLAINILPADFREYPKCLVKFENSTVPLWSTIMDAHRASISLRFNGSPILKYVGISHTSRVNNFFLWRNRIDCLWRRDVV